MNKYNKLVMTLILGIFSCGIMQAMESQQIATEVAEAEKQEVFLKNDTGYDLLLSNQLKGEEGVATVHRVVVPNEIVYIGLLKNLKEIKVKTYKPLLGRGTEDTIQGTEIMNVLTIDGRIKHATLGELQQAQQKQVYITLITITSAWISMSYSHGIKVVPATDLKKGMPGLPAGEDIVKFLDKNKVFPDDLKSPLFSPLITVVFPGLKFRNAIELKKTGMDIEKYLEDKDQLQKDAQSILGLPEGQGISKSDAMAAREASAHFWKKIRDLQPEAQRSKVFVDNINMIFSYIAGANYLLNRKEVELS